MVSAHMVASLNWGRRYQTGQKEAQTLFNYPHKLQKHLYIHIFLTIQINNIHWSAIKIQYSW